MGLGGVVRRVAPKAKRDTRTAPGQALARRPSPDRSCSRCRPTRRTSTSGGSRWASTPTSSARPDPLLNWTAATWPASMARESRHSSPLLRSPLAGDARHIHAHQVLGAVPPLGSRRCPGVSSRGAPPNLARHTTNPVPVIKVQPSSPAPSRQVLTRPDASRRRPPAGKAAESRALRIACSKAVTRERAASPRTDGEGWP